MSDASYGPCRSQNSLPGAFIPMDMKCHTLGYGISSQAWVLMAVDGHATSHRIPQDLS